MKIRKIILPLRIKGLGLTIYNINKYILIPIYIPTIKDGVNILYRILKEIFLVDNLKVYILLGNNIIGPKRIVLDISKSKVYISSYSTTTNIINRQRRPY